VGLDDGCEVGCAVGFIVGREVFVGNDIVGFRVGEIVDDEPLIPR